MDLKINYSKQALKFLKKNTGILDLEKVRELISKSARRILAKEDVNIDLKPLKGSYAGNYRIRYRDIRIIFELDSNRWLVWAFVKDIDFRGNIYNK